MGLTETDVMESVRLSMDGKDIIITQFQQQKIIFVLCVSVNEDQREMSFGQCILVQAFKEYL